MYNIKAHSQDRNLLRNSQKKFNPRTLKFEHFYITIEI